jgi:hypothetical protein
MISVPTLSDPNHPPGTQRMTRLGMLRTSRARLPVRRIGSDSARFLLPRLLEGRPARSRHLETASPPGCPRDDSASRRSRSHHHPVARTMIRPRVEIERTSSCPAMPSTSSSPASLTILRLPGAPSAILRLPGAPLRFSGCPEHRFGDPPVARSTARDSPVAWSTAPRLSSFPELRVSAILRLPGAPPARAGHSRLDPHSVARTMIPSEWPRDSDDEALCAS